MVSGELVNTYRGVSHNCGILDLCCRFAPIKEIHRKVLIICRSVSGEQVEPPQRGDIQAKSGATHRRLWRSDIEHFERIRLLPWRLWRTRAVRSRWHATRDWRGRWRNTVMRLRSRIVESVRVQCLVDNNVIFEQSLEVLLTKFAEQEGIDLRTKLLEGKVGGREESTTLMRVFGAIYLIPQASLAESQLESAEFAGQEVDDLRNLGRRYKEAVHAVDDAIRSKDVDSDKLACR